MEIEAKIREIIRRISQKEISPDPDQSLFESGLLDSFALPDMVSEIERQFSVQIPDSDLNPQRFDSVSRIRDYLEGRQAALPVASGNRHSAASPVQNASGKQALYAGIPGRVVQVATGQLDWEHANPNATFQDQGGMLSVSAKLEGWPQLVSSPVLTLEPNMFYRASFGFKLDVGHVFFYVIREENQTPILTLLRNVPQSSVTDERFVFRAPPGNGKTHLAIAANNGYKQLPVRFEVKKAILERVELNPQVRVQGMLLHPVTVRRAFT